MDTPTVMHADMQTEQPPVPGPSMERAEISPFDQQSTPMTYRAWPQPLLPDIETVLSPIRFTPSPFPRSESPWGRRWSCSESPSPSPSPLPSPSSSPAYSREPSPRTLPTRRHLEARREGARATVREVLSTRSSSRGADTVLESTVRLIGPPEPSISDYGLGDAVEEVARQNRFERLSARVSPCSSMSGGFAEPGEVLESGEMEQVEMLSPTERLASPDSSSPPDEVAEEPSGTQRRSLGKAVAGLGRRWSRRVSAWLDLDGLKRRDSAGVLGKRMSMGALKATRADLESESKRPRDEQEDRRSRGSRQFGPNAMKRQPGVSLGREVGMQEQRMLERDLGLQDTDYLTLEEEEALMAQMRINPAHLAVTPPGLDIREFSQNHQDYQEYCAKLEIAVWTAKERGVFDRKTLEKRLSLCSSKRNSRKLQLKAVEQWEQELADERKDRERRYSVAKRKRAVSEPEDFDKRSRAALEVQPSRTQSVRRRYSVWREIAMLGGVVGTADDVLML